MYNTCLFRLPSLSCDKFTASSKASFLDLTFQIQVSYLRNKEQQDALFFLNLFQ